MTDASGDVTTYMWSNGLLISETEPDNEQDGLDRTTTYQYDNDRRLSCIIDPRHQSTTYTYDSSGNPETLIDPLSRITQTVYDGLNRLVETVRPAPSPNQSPLATSTSYDAIGDVTGTVDARGISTTMFYDQRGNLKSTTEAAGTIDARTSYRTYDSANRLSSLIDPRGLITTFAYNADDRVTSTTEAYSTPDARTTQTFYDLLGNVVKTIDGRNIVEISTYDNSNRKILDTEASGTTDSRTTQTAYDFDGNIESTSDGRGIATVYGYDPEDRQVYVVEAANTSDARKSGQSYDADGNVDSSYDARGIATVSSHDADNRLISRTEAVGTPDARTLQWSYDAAGETDLSIDGRGISTTYTYDPDGRLSSKTEAAGTPDQRITTTSYDADDNVVATTDGRNIQTLTTYDNLNRATTVTEAAGTPATETTRTSYDLDDNVVKVVDANANSTVFGYDALNRRSLMTDPLGHSASYSYDGDDNLSSTTDRDGRRRDLTYDGLNRLVTEIWYDPSGSVSDVRNFNYDADDNMLSASNNNGRTTVSFTYDSLNRKQTERSPLGVTLESSYDANDDRTGLSDSLGATKTSTYDGLGRLSSIQWTGPSTGTAATANLRTDRTYTPTDQLATVTRYADLAGNEVVGTSSYQYDGLDRVKSLTHSAPDGTALENFTYSYDAADRLTSETSKGKTISYSYDDKNQLTSDGATTYSYDQAGNRSTPGYQVGPGNQVLSDGQWSYTYDNEGNRIKKVSIATGETWTYGYNDANEMIWVEDRSTDGGSLLSRVDYTYDALGRRFGVVENQGSPVFQSLPVIGDPGFESISMGTGGEAYAYAPTGSAWTFDSQSGVSGNGSGFTGANPDAPEGSQVAFLQSQGTISQAIAGWSAGSYQVSFWAVQRSLYFNNAAGEDFQVLVDGAVVGTFNPTGESAYQTYTTAAFTVSAGSHTLTFKGLDSSGNSDTAFLDDVRLAVAGAVSGDGLSATYFANQDLTGATVTRVDPTVNFDWGSGSPDPAIPVDHFSARWTGQVLAPVGGTYTFSTNSDDGSRLWVNGQLLVDQWTNHGPTVASGTITLAAGQRYTITMEYYENTDGALAQLLWTEPGHAREVIPPADLFSTSTQGSTTQTWTVYDGSAPYADLDASGRVTQRYISGPAVDELLARVSATGDVAWYLSDRLGSVRDLTDAAGVIRDHLDYDGFGQVTGETNPGYGDRFKYTGRELDPITGLQYNRGRYYDAALGGWTSPDPVGFGGGDANLYRYVGNQPTDYVDPSGESAITRWWDSAAAFTHELVVVQGGNALSSAGSAIKDTAEGAFALATSSEARAAFGAAYHETRVQPLANRLTAKAEFRGSTDPGSLELAAYAVEDMIGAKAVEAGVGFDLTGRQIEGGLFDGGERTQMALFGFAEATGFVAGGLGVASRATGLSFSLTARSTEIAATAIVGEAPKASSDPRKFTDYIFKEGADHGKDKVFRGLGYGKEHSQQLTELWQKQATEKFARGEYTLGKADQYGQRIDIEIELPGIEDAASKTSYLRSGWMIQSDGSIRLNTPFSGFTR